MKEEIYKRWITGLLIFDLDGGKMPNKNKYKVYKSIAEQIINFGKRRNIFKFENNENKHDNKNLPRKGRTNNTGN